MPCQLQEIVRRADEAPFGFTRFLTSHREPPEPATFLYLSECRLHRLLAQTILCAAFVGQYLYRLLVLPVKLTVVGLAGKSCAMGSRMVRWAASSLLATEKSFRRMGDLWILAAALDRHVDREDKAA